MIINLIIIIINVNWKTSIQDIIETIKTLKREDLGEVYLLYSNSSVDFIGNGYHIWACESGKW